MCQDKLGQLIGLRAKAMQGTVVAPHATVMAVLAAIIGHLDHGAHENMPAKLLAGGGNSVFVEGGLSGTVLSQFARTRKRIWSGHRQIKDVAGCFRKFFNRRGFGISYGQSPA